MPRTRPLTTVKSAVQPGTGCVAITVTDCGISTSMRTVGTGRSFGTLTMKVVKLQAGAWVQPGCAYTFTCASAGATAPSVSAAERTANITLGSIKRNSLHGFLQEEAHLHAGRHLR